MAVYLAPIAGVAAQFFDNNGNPLSGGKLYTYQAGTTTPAVTYTTNAGVSLHTNPIVLDSGGRIPNGGEVWLSDNISYKLILKTSDDVTVATWDNIDGINSNFLTYTLQQEIQTATDGQTVFNLSTITYQPATGTLSVYVDGLNQYGPDAAYSYVETDNNTVTFNDGLHEGALVKFTTAINNTGNAVDASVVTYTPAGTFAVLTNVQTKLRETVSVLDFGADPTGATDSTTKIQNAINYAVSSGQELYFPSGTYVISSTLTASGMFTMKGVPSSSYQDYAADIGQWLPSYAGKASVIQFALGSHGAILDCDYQHSITGMTFRCGQTRDSSDKFLADKAILSEYIDCKFENLQTIFGNDNTSAFGPQFVRGCRFFSCGLIAGGVVVDAIFQQNVFTSCGTLFSFTPGSGYVTIIGNRIEYCTAALYNYQGRAINFVGNLVDSTSSAAITLNAVNYTNITGNYFWRCALNGGAAGERSNIYFIGVCRSTNITGNTFEYGEQDGGGIPRPEYLMEFVSSAGSAIQWRGNSSYNGYTTGFIIDVGGGSQECLDADRFDLTIGKFNPNTASDTFAPIVTALNDVLITGSNTKLFIYEDRKVNSYGNRATNLFVCSGVTAGITINQSSGSLITDRLNNITIGQKYTDKGGATYADNQPNGYPQYGSFNIGKIVYYNAPTSGGYIGSVKISSGSPDTWKTFGLIS